MSYVLAILGLAAVCVAWVMAQRWAGLLDDDSAAGDGDRDVDCDGCAVEDTACPVVQLHDRSGEH